MEEMRLHHAHVLQRQYSSSWFTHRAYGADSVVSSRPLNATAPA